MCIRACGIIVRESTRCPHLEGRQIASTGDLRNGLLGCEQELRCVRNIDIVLGDMYPTPMIRRAPRLLRTAAHRRESHACVREA